MKTVLPGIYRICLYAALAAALAVSGPDARAESFFQMLKNKSAEARGADPSQTLRAPFIDPAQQGMPTARAMNLPYGPDLDEDNGVKLAEPHRDADQVGEWVTETVSSALNVSAATYPQHVEDMAKTMSRSAINSYDTFMRDSQVLNRMKAYSENLNSFVEEKPLLLNKGVIEGRYRWLYDVPVALTFMSTKSVDYTNIAVNSDSNYRLLVRIQVGRVDDASTSPYEVAGPVDENNTDGLVIESWEVRRNPFR